MRASRVEDDPSVLYIRLVDSRIRSQQTAFHSEDESRDAHDYLVRLSKNEFAQLGRETILRSNLLRLDLRQDSGEVYEPPFGDGQEMSRKHDEADRSKAGSD